MPSIVFTTMDESIVQHEFYILLANSHPFRLEILEALKLGISFNSEPDSIDSLSYHTYAIHVCNLIDMIAAGLVIVPQRTMADVVAAIMLDPGNWRALSTEIKMAEAMEYGP